MLSSYHYYNRNETIFTTILVIATIFVGSIGNYNGWISTAEKCIHSNAIPQAMYNTTLYVEIRFSLNFNTNIKDIDTTNRKGTMIVLMQRGKHKMGWGQIHKENSKFNVIHLFVNRI